MQYARIGQLRDGLSRYLEQVRAGEEIVVLARTRPIARIVPATGDKASSGTDRQRLVALERRGVLRRGRGRFPAALKGAPPKLPGGSLLADLQTERESGW